jgi:hypothetical protein
MHRIFTVSPVGLLLALIVILAPTAGRAEEWTKEGEERFLLSGGFFLPFFSTSLGVDNEGGGAGETVNLETDLGFTEDVATGETVAAGFARRHRLGQLLPIRESLRRRRRESP